MTLFIPSFSRYGAPLPAMVDKLLTFQKNRKAQPPVTVKAIESRIRLENPR